LAIIYVIVLDYYGFPMRVIGKGQALMYSPTAEPNGSKQQ